MELFSFIGVFLFERVPIERILNDKEGEIRMKRSRRNMILALGLALILALGGVITAACLGWFGKPAQATPVWQFCHGVRDGLETAVITGYETDCEEGLIPVELSSGEAEEIRRLAIEGVVTGKANDMSVTGGTWVYTFKTPEGEYLLSIELYKGLLVSVDGMYNFSYDSP